MGFVIGEFIGTYSRFNYCSLINVNRVIGLFFLRVLVFVRIIMDYIEIYYKIGVFYGDCVLNFLFLYYFVVFCN